MKPKYPEHDKMALCAGEAVHVRAFLDWLTEDQGVVMGKLSSGTSTTAPIDEHELAFCNREEILARYFGYDLAKLEEERRSMVREIQRSTDG